MKKIVLFVFLSFSSLLMFGQKGMHHKAPLHHDSHNKSVNSIKFPWGIFVGMGSNSYYGDLSGFRHSFKAINYQFTFGVSYRFNKRITAQASYRILRLAASDEESSIESFGRKKRHLSFRSMVHEFGITGTFDIFNFDFKHTPDYSHATGFYPYLLAGVGLIHYNPTTEYNGQVYELRPLITSREKAEGLKYGSWAAYTTYGVGGKLKVSSFICFGMELTYTNTFTDNLDDLISGSHYTLSNNDPNYINTIDGQLADRSLETDLNTSRREAGGLRSFDINGGRNDGYFAVTLRLEYAFNSWSNFFNDKASHFRQRDTPFHKH